MFVALIEYSVMHLLIPLLILYLPLYTDSFHAFSRVWSSGIVIFVLCIGSMSRFPSTSFEILYDGLSDVDYVVNFCVLGVVCEWRKRSLIISSICFFRMHGLLCGFLLSSCWFICVYLKYVLYTLFDARESCSLLIEFFRCCLILPALYII